MTASQINGLPVVTVKGGDDVAEVRDVIYSPEAGRLLGLTLNKRGFFAGRRREVLPAEAIHAIGRDAVMIVDDSSLIAPEDAPSDVGHPATERNVIGNDVLTDGGKRLGTVVDVVVQVSSGEVVGYELTGDQELQAHAGRPLLIPIPATLAVSGTALLVPSSVEPFIRDDLTGFGAAVQDFRSQLPQET